MGNSELEIKIECYQLIEILLKNFKDSKILTTELESLKEKYCKNIIN